MTATVTNDGLFLLAEYLNVQTLPSVLSSGPQQDTIEAWERARADADATLHADGLIDSYGDVDADIADALHVLSHPDTELVARIYRPSGARKVALARRGHHHALGIRTDGDVGEKIELHSIWADGDPTNLARPIIEALGRCKPAEITGFSAPTRELAEAFNAAGDAGEFAATRYADAIAAHGVKRDDALNFGIAMASCHGHAEIVACTYDHGLTTMGCGAVAVYDTDRGRIVTSPRPAPDGNVWSTITPGSDHRIAQAISALIETLPGERWMPPF